MSRSFDEAMRKQREAPVDESPGKPCVTCGNDGKEYFRVNDKPTRICYKCWRKTDDAKKPVTTSSNKLAEIRDKKRVEMIEKGELCYRCGRGAPDPGHELCFGCEQATTKRVVAPALGKMPESCVYGWLGEFAKTLDAPLDAAYPVVLAIAAGYGVPAYKRLRSNLYVNIIGEKGSGKTRVIDRALESWTPPSDMQLIRKYPGSEVGLIQLLGGKKAKDMEAEDRLPSPYLLVQDEMRITFNKMDIKGSSLPNMLNELFYHSNFGTAAKQGHWECCASLSVIGGLTCNSPNEFAEIYGAATAQGTFDRTLFGIMPNDWEFDEMWEPQTGKYTTVQEFDSNMQPLPAIELDVTIQRRARACTVPKEIYEAVGEWRRKDFENRRRMGELVLRVALVTASLNHDEQITPECLQCALEFIEWQERIRSKYNPAETDDLDGLAERAIIRALEECADWVDWRSLCKKRNLYRAAKSSVRLNRVKRAMIFENIIEEEYTPKENDGSGGDRTGRVRLKA
jgi:hypothetical protein